MKTRIKLAAGSLAIVWLIVMIIATPAMAAQNSLVAEVTVSTMINFTVEDHGDAGLKFGSLLPGSSDNQESAQNGSGAIRLSIGPETNVDCDISAKANDFTSGSNIMPIGNAKWDIDNEANGATAMTNAYAKITTLSPGNSQDIWHWLSIPGNQAPGTYTTNFYYQAVAVIS